MIERTQTLLQAHPYLSERESSDWPAVQCPQDRIISFLQHLKEDADYDFLADLTAIDHFEARPRFEVVYHLYSTERHEYIRVATACNGEAEPSCLSVVSLWATADWHEREAYDMFGIRFEGHPDLRRILMWDGYPYFPLRKEFPLAGKEVEVPSPDLEETTGVRVAPAPMMGGPFHATQTGAMSKREPRADDESWTETAERGESQSDNEAPRELRGEN